MAAASAAMEGTIAEEKIEQNVSKMADILRGNVVKHYERNTT